MSALCDSHKSLSLRYSLISHALGMRPAYVVRRTATNAAAARKKRTRKQQMNRKQAERFVWLSNALGKLGMSAVEINILLRAERTLGRWATDECNGDIRRDGDDGEGKPFRVYGRNHEHRYQIADREAGALRRVKAVCDRHGVTFYHQGDPRGCALYIIRPGDVPAGSTVDSCYSRGLAVCID